MKVLCVYFTAIWRWRSISGQRPSLALVFSLVLAISLLSIIYLTSHCDYVFVQEPNPFFVSSVWPVHISGNQNQSLAPGVRRPTSPGRSHLLGVNSGGLVILIHIPWYIFCLSLKSRYECWNMLKCGPKSTLYQLHLSSFPFFPLSTCVLSILQLPRKHCPAFPKFKTHYWILASG